MSLKCSNCDNTVVNVGEVRGCGTCQRNGTAGGVHSKFLNHDSVEALVADANPGAFPFVAIEEPTPEPEKPDTPEPPAPRAARLRRKNATS